MSSRLNGTLVKKEHYLFGCLPNKYYFCSMNK